MRWQPSSQCVGGVRRFTRAAALTLALTAALAAGCGSGPKEVVLPGPEAPTAELTKAAFIKQANEVCRAAAKAIAERTDAGGPSALGPEGQAGDLYDIRPIADQAISRLKNLTPPVADQAVHQRMITLMQETVDRARGDAQAFINPINLPEPDLSAYGLTGCFRRG